MCNASLTDTPGITIGYHVSEFTTVVGGVFKLIDNLQDLYVENTDD